MKRLKTIEEHNRDRERGRGGAAGRESGIECPVCRRELAYVRPATTLVTHPLDREVECESCGFSGTVRG